MKKRIRENLRFRTAATLLAALFVLASCEDSVLAAIEEEVRQAQLANVSLTVLTSTIGTVSPEGSIQLKDGDSVDVQAIPPATFEFLRWEQVSGSGTAVFADSASALTSVTLSGGSATIRAVWNDVVDPTGTIAILDKILISGTYYRNSRTVDVALTFDDNSGSVQRMKLSRVSFPRGTTSGWENAAAGTTFTFQSDGAQNLYVRFQDESGNESDIYSTDVYIDSTAPVPTLAEVVHSAAATVYREYVTGVSDSVISLVYEAGDAGSGVEKVYFSNTPTRPALPQISSYSEPHSPYPWELTIYTSQYKDYTVYFWFEDKLGNRNSTPYSDTVRYDDNYEGPWGNNSADAVSGATLIMDDAADLDDRLITFVGPSQAQLLDADVYKFGFYDSYYYGSIKFYLNTTGPAPRVTFYDHSGAVIIPSAVYDPPDYFDVQYDLTFPYVNTGGYPYYIYVRVDKIEAEPYSQYLGYDMGWEFFEQDLM
jgi:Divergent InlB B-repeat domain